MLAHGDEMGRTQQRQQQRVLPGLASSSWMDWSLAETNADLLEFTRRAIALRTAHPVFRRRRFFEGRPIRSGEQARDIAWLTPSGEEMTPADWDSGFGKSLAVFLNGDGHPRTERARRAGRRRLVPAVLQRPRRGDRVHRPPTTATAATGRRAWTPPTGQGIDRPVRRARATSSPLPARSVIVLRERRDWLRLRSALRPRPPAHLPAAARGRTAFTFADAARAASTTSTTSVSRTCTSRRC